MKKIIIPILVGGFLMSVAGGAFAAEATPVATPAVKVLKSHRMKHRKKTKKSNKKVETKAVSTPKAK